MIFENSQVVCLPSPPAEGNIERRRYIRIPFQLQFSVDIPFSGWYALALVIAGQQHNAVSAITKPGSHFPAELVVTAGTQRGSEIRDEK
jgi:hypothetical protein